jgi:predicted AAA+ superfamily ATPase
MMWIQRKIEDLLRTRAATRPVVVRTGARQTGKTSLVQRLFPSYEYVSLDLPSEAAQAEHEPDGFLSRHRPPLIVDEVQYAPSLFRHVKTVVDRRRSENGLFILTGSQKLTPMKSISESLAGRADVLELETLSWAEAHAAVPSLTLERFIVNRTSPPIWRGISANRSR